MRSFVVLTTALSLCAAIGLAIYCRDNRLVWDHFDVVKDGIMYRSGQLEPEQLAQAVKRYGLKTVVSFQVGGEGVENEHRLAKELGVSFVNLPMPGDGAGREEQFREVLKLLDDPARRPIIVHCARGTCRTGAAVGIYRLERDGWTIEDVAAEMRRQTYRDGWLPGFVYSMVKERPFDERYQPLIRRDLQPGSVDDESGTSSADAFDGHSHDHDHDHQIAEGAHPVSLR